jgi:cellulose synthase/poly-beta-1,6-N-acetylglucosamine synthase-like glycosyltransferase
VIAAPLPRASVIICAYTLRRWDDLVAAVDAVRALPEATEVILVIDHERSLLARARAHWPTLLIVPSAGSRGLSGARNTGVDLAAGEVVAFVDDDAVADPDWLRYLLAPFGDPGVVAVGGHARPVWPRSGPGMYAPELFWIVGCSHAGLPTAPSEVRNVIGSSMAFLRSSIMDAGGFNPDTGRIGRVPLGCEETELCIRISQQDPGASLRLEPRAAVNHRVTADRVTWLYLTRRSYYEGVSKAALSRALGRHDSLSTESAYLSTVIPRAILRELTAPRTGGLVRAAGIILSVGATVAGYAAGTLRSARLGPARIASAADRLQREASQ